MLSDQTEFIDFSEEKHEPKSEPIPLPPRPIPRGEAGGGVLESKPELHLIESVLQNQLEQVIDSGAGGGGMIDISRGQLGNELLNIVDKPDPFSLGPVSGRPFGRKNLEAIQEEFLDLSEQTGRKIGNLGDLFGIAREGLTNITGIDPDSFDEFFSLHNEENVRAKESADVEEFSDVGSIFKPEDIDGNGVITKEEVALGKVGQDLIKRLDILNPLLARIPDGSSRQISRKKIQDETKKERSNQVNLVQQAYARNLEDANLFNVRF